MKRIFFLTLQCLWGLPQTLLGAVLFLVHCRCQHSRFRGAIVTWWTRPGGLSLGPFIFLRREPREQRVLVHEYGHTIQSLILGPLYLLVIGIPSFTWASLPALRRMRRKKGISYYTFYPEKWADRLGQRVTGTNIAPGGERLTYFITNAQRKRRGTCFFELQKGVFGNRHWLEDSLMLPAEDFDRLELWKLFQAALPHFNYYGPTQVTPEQYRLLKKHALAAGGEAAAVIRELDPWAEACLNELGCFTILGI